MLCDIVDDKLNSCCIINIVEEGSYLYEEFEMLECPVCQTIAMIYEEKWQYADGWNEGD